MRVAVRFPAAEARLGAMAVLLFVAPIRAQQSKAASAGSTPVSSQRQFLDRYCVGCHNERLRTGGMSLVPADSAKPGAQPELWEKVVRKLRTGVMPPPTRRCAGQPSELSIGDRRFPVIWRLEGAASRSPARARIE